MIRTPSLRNRMTAAALAIVVLVVLVVDGFVYLSLAGRMDDILGQVLDARTQAATQVGRTTSSTELVTALSDAGIPAVVRFPDGREERTEPGSRLFDRLPPDADAASALQDTAVVELADGTQVEVLVSRGGATSTLRRVLVFETIGSLLAVGLAVVLLHRAARLVTRPIDRMVDVADDIADGQTDLRLDPSDPSTEVGRMAAALDRVVAALDEALESTRQAERRSRVFLADAAHQMRTPVAGLRASAETLLTAPATPERDRLLESVTREADRIGRLVDALLDMARLDQPVPIVPRPVDIGEVVRTEVARRSALATGVALRADAPAGPVVVQGDRHWIQAAIANLLDNAARHASSEVVVRLRPADDTTSVLVADDGPGVQPADRERVFERFVSLDGGSGLGLPVARAVARAHDGSLDVDERGFELLLPVAGPARPAPTHQ